MNNIQNKNFGLGVSQSQVKPIKENTYIQLSSQDFEKFKLFLEQYNSQFNHEQQQHEFLDNAHNTNNIGTNAENIVESTNLDSDEIIDENMEEYAEDVLDPLSIEDLE